MNNLQRIIIILAAFGIVSIVLSQAHSSYSINSLDTKPSAERTEQASNIAANVFIDASSSDNAQVTINEGLQTSYITNIYQSGRGSFYIQDSETDSGQTLFLPSVLKKTDAEINVTGPIARTRLTQVFKNTSDSVKSGVYVFPLPQDAAVDGLLMTIGDRKIEGQIKRKETAEKMFVKAKSQGKKASLISQIRPNMFTNRIANIPPHAEISVTIEYQQFIVQDKYNFELRLPLSITPRYQSDTSLNHQAESLYHLGANIQDTDTFTEVSSHSFSKAVEEDNLLKADTNISVKLNTGLPISFITSEHHPIKTTNTRETEYQITLDTKEVANKDFVLNWQMRAGHSIQAAHFSYESDSHEYGLITLMPPIAETVASQRNLIFILDVSGSMAGEAITQAKQALAIAISDLNDEDYFNIITFSSDASRLWPQSQLASSAFKDEALYYLYNVEANGGTEIKKALNLAFSLPKTDELAPSSDNNHYVNQILFITDGSVGNEDELMQIIYQKLDDYRLFTVGIGNAPNAFFMQEAAIAGKGTFTFIGDVNMVKPKMQSLLEKIKRPALSNIQLNIKDAQEAYGFEVYPSILPDLYAGEPLVISYKRQLLGALNENSLPFSIHGEQLSETVNGQSKKRRWSSQLPKTTVKRKQGIHKYWAKMKIQDLNRQLNMRGRHSEGFEKLQENIKEGITKVALDHHLVSQYTSLIAIDHSLSFASARSKAHKASLQQFAHAKLPQTANATSLYLVIGLVFMMLSLALIMCRKPNYPTIKSV